MRLVQFLKHLSKPQCHRFVILSAPPESDSARSWLLAKEFFPKRQKLGSFLAAGAFVNDFWQAPEPHEVSAVLGALTDPRLVFRVRKLGEKKCIPGTGVRLCRHYFTVDDPDFWDLAPVQRHRMKFSWAAGADTLTSLCEHSSYPLGTVGRQVAEVIARKIPLRQAA